MRKIIVSNNVTLDGFFEGPNHEIDWFMFDKEAFDDSVALLNSVDTILFGRTTYQMMAAYWPVAAPDAVAERMNRLPKIVFSNTLQAVQWNNTRLIKGDVAEQVARLKQQPGGDMVVLGSAKLASSLLQTRLVDEYRVHVIPVLIGNGRPLFPDIAERLQLRLLGTKALGSGVVIQSYAKA